MALSMAGAALREHRGGRTVAETATVRLSPQGVRSGGMDRQRSHDTAQFLEHSERSCEQQLLEPVRLRVLIAMVLHAAPTAANWL